LNVEGFEVFASEMRERRREEARSIDVSECLRNTKEAYSVGLFASMQEGYSYYQEAGSCLSES
jgi:hypothetical protein